MPQKAKVTKTLNFNTEIYKKGAVQKAVRVFEQCGKFEIGSDEKYITVVIRSAHPDIKGILADEFSNYVLAMTKRCQ